MKYEYCPNGNYWKDVSGILDTEKYMWCDCKKCGGKMYTFRVKDITKNIKPEVIKRVREDITLDEIRHNVTRDNMEKVRNLISPQ